MRRQAVRCGGWAAAMCVAAAVLCGAQAGDGWTDLVGADFKAHWDTTGNWIQDADGVITLTPREGEKGWSRWKSYLWSKKTYGEFEIEFDYKVQKGGNSGFYFRTGDVNDPVSKGVEVQIYASHGKPADKALTDHDSGGVIPGLPPKKNAAKPQGEWNTFHIVCKGDKLTVELNGEQVNEVDLTQGALKSRPPVGSIGFQDHALPLSLRKIRIRELNR